MRFMKEVKSLNNNRVSERMKKLIKNSKMLKVSITVKFNMKCRCTTSFKRTIVISVIVDILVLTFSLDENAFSLLK